MSREETLANVPASGMVFEKQFVRNRCRCTEENCLICYEDFRDHETIVAHRTNTPDKRLHCFHLPCLHHWRHQCELLHKPLQCPMCETPLTYHENVHSPASTIDTASYSTALTPPTPPRPRPRAPVTRRAHRRRAVHPTIIRPARSVRRRR